MNEFILTVQKMREAQKGYFAAEHGSLKKRDFLHESKLLEKQVDEMIKQLTNPQKSLF